MKQPNYLVQVSIVLGNIRSALHEAQSALHFLQTGIGQGEWEIPNAVAKEKVLGLIRQMKNSLESITD